MTLSNRGRADKATTAFCNQTSLEGKKKKKEKRQERGKKIKQLDWIFY